MTPPTLAEPTPATPPSPSGEDTQTPQPLPAWAIGLLIFLAALIIRLVYLFEIHNAALFNYLVADAQAYREWAVQIARGDWIGREPFYQAPLYPYFLAVVMKIVGGAPLLLRAAQAVVGASACVLLFHAGRLMFSRTVGILAGAIFALYPPAIFYDALIQKAVLDGVGVAALLYLAARAQANPTPRMFLALGACLGELILSRENALLFIPVVAAWILYYFARQPIATRLRSVLLFCAGVAIVLTPVTIRNYYVSGELIFTTYQGGPNFFIGNNPNADGSYVPLRAGRGNTPFERADATLLAERAAGRKLSPREVSSYWFGRGFDFVREQPAAWLRLLGLKALYAVNTYEIPDAEDPNYYAEYSSILRYLRFPLHFGVIFPLAGAALVLCAANRRILALPAALTLAVIVGVTVFYVFGRYRYPMAPMLILMTSAGIVAIVQRIRAGKVASLAPALAAALPLAIVANLPTPYPADTQLAVSHTNAGIELARHGKLTDAERELRTALRIAPNFRDANFGLGKILLMSGRMPEALQSLQAALDAGPNVPYILTVVGIADLMRGDPLAAETHLKNAVGGDPYDGEAWVNLSEAYVLQGRWADALDAAQRCANNAPRDPACLLRLAWLQATLPPAQMRDGAAALQNAQDGLKLLGAPDAQALDALAAAYAETGRLDEAVRTQERAVQLAGAAANPAAAEPLEQRLAQYKSHQPYRLSR